MPKADVITMGLILHEKGGGQMLDITGQGASAVQMFTIVDRDIPAWRPANPGIVQVLDRTGFVVAA